VFTISNKLKIGFFASSFANRYGSGTAKHIEKITKLICTNYQLSIEVIFFCNNQEQYLYIKKDQDYQSAKIIFLPKVNGNILRSSRQYFKYAFKAKSEDLDVLHFSMPRLYPFFWLFPAKKFVCTFHAGGDITAEKDSFILSREIYNLIAKIFWRKLDAIIAVSEYGKTEISQAYKIDRKKITTIHGGTDDIWGSSSSGAESIYSKPDRKLIVVVGRWQKYKNVQFVSRGLADANPKDLYNYYFVFVGKKITPNAKVIEQQLINVDKQVYDAFDYLDDESYANLIRHADLVIVPSLNEGFSHPIFDAFSLGTRVMLHKPSPAAQILNGRMGVYTADLSKSHNLLELISNAILMPKVDMAENRLFLKSIDATWNSTTKNYIKLYETLL